MPQLIQRAPVGLLGLFDSKAGGTAPNLLSDTVAGIVDLAPMYGLQQQQTRIVSIALATVIVGFNPGAGSFSIVPPGEVWRMRNIAGSVSNVIAAGIDLAVGYADPNSRFSKVGDYIACATATRPYLGGPVDVWLNPGWQIGAWVGRTAAGADIQLVFHFERYLV